MEQVNWNSAPRWCHNLRHGDFTHPLVIIDMPATLEQGKLVPLLLLYEEMTRSGTYRALALIKKGGRRVWMYGTAGGYNYNKRAHTLKDLALESSQGVITLETGNLSLDLREHRDSAGNPCFVIAEHE